MPANLGLEWSMIAHRVARVWVEVFDAGTNLHVAGASVAIGGSALASGLTLTTGSDGQATGDFGITGNANSVGLVGEITAEVTASSSGTSSPQVRQVVSGAPYFTGLSVLVTEVPMSEPRRFDIVVSGRIESSDGYYGSGAYNAYFGGGLSGTFSVAEDGFLSWSTQITSQTVPTGTIYATATGGYGLSGTSQASY